MLHCCHLRHLRLRARADDAEHKCASHTHEQSHECLCRLRWCCMAAVT